MGTRSGLSQRFGLVRGLLAFLGLDQIFWIVLRCRDLVALDLRRRRKLFHHFPVRCAPCDLQLTRSPDLSCLVILCLEWSR